MDLLANDLFRLTLLGMAAGLVAVTWYVLRRTRPRGRRAIRVVGVGGAGANAVDAMIRAGLPGVDYVAVNTDFRALNRSSASTKVALGRSTTRGLGTGGDVASGEAAAREAAEAIGDALNGSDLVVIVAGLGGGTGSAAAPVIAEVARGQGALTLAVVTTPFAFEGSRRARVAQDAAAAMVGLVDAVATIPNDRMRDAMSADVTVEDAFRTIDEAVHRSVAEIVELVAVTGRINLDFADVRAVLRGGGAAAVGFGRADGQDRAVEATRRAMAAAQADTPIRGASSVLVNVSGSRKLRLAEVDAVVETVLAATGRDTNIMFGVSLRPRLREEVHVTLIAAAPAAGADRMQSTPTVQSSPAVPSITPKSLSAQSLVAQTLAPPSLDADSIDLLPTEAERSEAASEELADAEERDWRPVWLRRATPPSTPAPESSSVHRSRGGKGGAKRSRRSQGVERAPRPDEGG